MLVFQQGNNCDYQKSGSAECTQGFICNHSITSLPRELPSTVSQASPPSLFHRYDCFTIFFFFSFLFHSVLSYSRKTRMNTFLRCNTRTISLLSAAQHAILNHPRQTKILTLKNIDRQPKKRYILIRKEKPMNGCSHDI